MNTIHFTKAEGAQNDFVIVDDRMRRLDGDMRRAFAIWSAHRRKGVGSDGCIFIDASTTHDFTMVFYNPDGSVDSMCGNGGRCAALFARQNGIAGTHMQFEVLGKSYRANVDGNNVLLSFPPPERIERGIALTGPDASCVVDFIDTGAPHVIVFADALPAALRAPLAAVDMEKVGRSLRHHVRFAPRGTNVNVLERGGDGSIAIRTFEKGVEAETEACGTGTLAAGMSAHLRLGIDPPVRLRTHGGDILTVHFTPGSVPAEDPRYFAADLALEGPAHLLFDGCAVLPVE
ncbi:MAG: diaminopimelate epimerase [Bacteroidota bacterium]|nr:diaminopimelate epimerase [Bacteroidota bacterium]